MRWTELKLFIPLIYMNERMWVFFKACNSNRRWKSYLVLLTKSWVLIVFLFNFFPFYVFLQGRFYNFQGEKTEYNTKISTDSKL